MSLDIHLWSLSATAETTARLSTTTTKVKVESPGTHREVPCIEALQHTQSPHAASHVDACKFAIHDVVCVG